MMNATPGPSKSKILDDALLASSVSCIQEGHSVLFKLPNGDCKYAKVEKNLPISLGKYGTFNSSTLVDQPYGLTYEIINKKLRVLPPKTVHEIEETEATNELIDDGLVQPLSTDEIEALKRSGVHASEIIKKQIELHVNFNLKTEYSKEKYLKRKEAKFAKKFTTIEPTIHNVCEFWYKKDPNRIRGIRPDTLAQMMNLAGVRPAGRYLVVDDASGLLVTAVLDRLNSEGQIVTVCDVESPPAYPIMSHMNIKEQFVTKVLSSLNWATADEDYMPILPPTEPESGDFQSERQKRRLNKRKGVIESLYSTREDLFTGGFEALIVASDYEPYSIIKRLTPYLSGSASIVVHSPHLQVVSELQATLRSLPGYLGSTVTEGWLRRYQVLPGRTHPLMMTSGTGGYLLHAIKIYDDPNATGVVLKRMRNKKQKTGSSTPIPESDEKDSGCHDETVEQPDDLHVPL